MAWGGTGGQLDEQQKKSQAEIDGAKAEAAAAGTLLVKWRPGSQVPPGPLLS